MAFITASALAGGRFLKSVLEDTFPEEEGGVLFSGHWVETRPGLPHLKQGRSYFGTSGLGQSEVW